MAASKTRRGIPNKTFKYIMRYLKPDGSWGYVYPKGFKTSSGALTHTPEEIAHKVLFGHAYLDKNGTPVTQDGHLYRYEARWDSKERKYKIFRTKRLEGFAKIEWAPGYEPGSRTVESDAELRELNPDRPIKPSTKDPTRTITKKDIDAEVKQVVDLEQHNPYAEELTKKAWAQVLRKNPKTMADVRAVLDNYAHDHFEGDENTHRYQVQALVDFFIDNKSVRAKKGSVSFSGNSVLSAIEKHMLTDPKKIKEALKRPAKLPSVDPDLPRTVPDTAPSTFIHAPVDKPLLSEMAITSKDPMSALQEITQRLEKVIQHAGDPPADKAKRSKNEKPLTVDTSVKPEIQKVNEVPLWVLDKYSEYHDGEADMFDSLTKFYAHIRKQPITVALTLGITTGRGLSDPAREALVKEWQGSIRYLARKIATGSVYSAARGQAETDAKMGNKAALTDFDKKLMQDLIDAGEDELVEMLGTYHASQDPRDRFDRQMNRFIKNSMLQKFKQVMADKNLTVPLVDDIAGNEDEGIVKEASEMSPEDMSELYRVQDVAAGILAHAMSNLEPNEEAAFLQRLWLDDLGAQEEASLLQKRADMYGEDEAREQANAMYSKDVLWMRRYTGDGAGKFTQRIAASIRAKKPELTPESLQNAVRAKLETYYGAAREKLRDRLFGTAEGEIVARWLGLRAKLAAHVRREYSEAPRHEVVGPSLSRTEYQEGWERRSKQMAAEAKALEEARAKAEAERASVKPEGTIAKALIADTLIKSIPDGWQLPSTMETPEFVYACDLLAFACDRLSALEVRWISL